MNEEIIYEVVKKLIGKIHPVGETNTDGERFENLKALCSLTDKLLTDIDDIECTYKGRHEYSINRAGEYAGKFLTRIGITE